jgi:hypothetical protein
MTINYLCPEMDGCPLHHEHIAFICVLISFDQLVLNECKEDSVLILTMTITVMLKGVEGQGVTV